MDMKLCFVCVLEVFALFYIVSGDDGKEGKSLKPCRSSRHVCTTLMKYPDGYVANEGPYCKCNTGDDCGSAWSEDDGRSLTWKHYERNHWKVQYRFCTPIVDKEQPECEGNKRAADVKTDIKEWKPFLVESRCRCPENMYHMTGWKKEGDVWNYFYHCEKKDCEEADGVVCAKMIVDTNRKSDIVKEVIFHCACPQGYLCPAKIKDESKVQGKEVLINCERIQKSSKKEA